MAVVDVTHKKLKFPPRFLPYLEKHRIFELIHECAELLVQERPADHLVYLKKILSCAAMKKDKQRIVFIAPSTFDRELFSELVADCLDIQVISRLYVEDLTRGKLKGEERERSEMTEEGSTEEVSCICLGEGEEKIIYPFFYQQPKDEGEFLAEGEETEELFAENEQSSFGNFKSRSNLTEDVDDQCVCVCPCVENEAKRAAELAAEKEAAKEEAEEKEINKQSYTQLSKKDSDEEGTFEGEDGTLVCEDYSFKTPKTNPYKGRTTLGTTLEPESIFVEEPIDIEYGLLSQCKISAKGWILEDLPVNGEEAEKLSALGVIPTHAFRIIIDEEEEMKDIYYKWLVQDWIKAYKFVPVVEIKMGSRTMQELARAVCQLASVMPHRHAPMLPRIVLIGSRGAGVTTQAEMLAKKFNYVHVEFDIVMTRALEQNDEFSVLYKRQLATRVDPELEAFLLERTLVNNSCSRKGWVLTGYPKNIDQMRMLDLIVTPPNRVIFIEVPPKECFVRLYYRKIDMCLGDEYKPPNIQPDGIDSFKTFDIKPEVAQRLVSHPKNDKKQVVHDIETYCLAKKEMMSYCGKTAFYVDGNNDPDTVLKLIEKIIMSPSPPFPPRNPLSINQGIHESYENLKKFRLSTGLFLNNFFLNPPERVVRV